MPLKSCFFRAVSAFPAVDGFASCAGHDARGALAGVAQGLNARRQRALMTLMQ